MITRDEVIGQIPDTYKKEELLFNLKLFYNKGDLDMPEGKRRRTYSQIRLTFNKAKKIAEHPEWGLSQSELDELIDTSFIDNEQSRHEVFEAYMRVALSAIAFKVSLAPRNNLNRNNVEIALNNTFAGILPYQFGDDYSGKLVIGLPEMEGRIKRKEREAFKEQLEAFQAHVEKLIEEAKRLWLGKLTFTYAGRFENIRQALDSEKGYPKETTTKDEIHVTHMEAGHCAKFLGGLMRIFGVGETKGPTPAGTLIKTATGKVKEEKTTEKGTVIYEAERRKASLAEVLIAVGRNSRNILVTSHLKDTDTGGGFTPNFDGTGDYTLISFREDILEKPQKDWENYSYHDPQGAYSQNLWWIFSHELLHVYPIYESEYRKLDDEEKRYHYPTKDDYKKAAFKALQDQGIDPKSVHIWSSEEMHKYGLESWEEYRNRVPPKPIQPPGHGPGEYEEFEIRESPEEDVPAFKRETVTRERKVKLLQKLLGPKFEEIPTEVSFAAYDLSDPEQVKWLRGWFEGRLDAWKKKVLSFPQLLPILKEPDGKITTLEQMESMLEGILAELKEFKKLMPDLALPDDKYDPQKVAVEKVTELLKKGLVTKIEGDYVLRYEEEFDPLWKVWAEIASEFALENLYKEIAEGILNDYEKEITDIYRGSRDGSDSLIRIRELKSKIETDFFN